MKNNKLAEIIKTINDRWSNVPPVVEAAYTDLLKNEDYWSDTPQHHWSKPYFWSEKGTA